MAGLRSTENVLRVGGMVLGSEVHMYRDSSLSIILDQRRRMKATLDVILSVRNRWFSFARRLDLTRQWDRILQVSSLPLLATLDQPRSQLPACEGRQREGADADIAQNRSISKNKQTDEEEEEEERRKKKWEREGPAHPPPPSRPRKGPYHVPHSLRLRDVYGRNGVIRNQ